MGTLNRLVDNIVNTFVLFAICSTNPFIVFQIAEAFQEYAEDVKEIDNGRQEA